LTQIISRRRFATGGLSPGGFAIGNGHDTRPNRHPGCVLPKASPAEIRDFAVQHDAALRHKRDVKGLEENWKLESQSVDSSKDTWGARANTRFVI
jgi:hypothetical protein